MWAPWFVCVYRPLIVGDCNARAAGINSGMDMGAWTDAGLLSFWNAVRVWSGGLAAIAAMVSFAAGYYANKLQPIVSAQKERATAETLAHERAERVRIEDKVAPRRLSAEQRAGLIRMAHTLHFAGPVLIIALPAAEPETYAQELAAAFNAAGVEAEVGGNFTIRSAEGLIIVRGESTHADDLDQILNSAEIPAEVHSLDFKPTQGYLVVGYKPD
jgi:hypothetical protein